MQHFAKEAQSRSTTALIIVSLSRPVFTQNLYNQKQAQASELECVWDEVFIQFFFYLGMTRGLVCLDVSYC